MTFPTDKLLSANFKAEISVKTLVPLRCFLKKTVSETFEFGGF